MFAGDKGVHMIIRIMTLETFVWSTRDKNTILFHDSKVMFLFNGHVNIGECSSIVNAKTLIALLYSYV